MLSLLLVFAAIFLLNVVPAFAPPTWMALSLIGFNFPQANPLVLALIAAIAASCGRMLLATLSHRLIRQRLLSANTCANIDVLKETLEQRKEWTIGAMLAYAFTPLPTNYLFIAYGLTALPLMRIVVPFFCGRLVSYAAWTLLAQGTAKHLAEQQSQAMGAWFSAYFLLTQCALLLLVYAFTKIDWKSALKERKFRWFKRNNEKKE